MSSLNEMEAKVRGRREEEARLLGMTADPQPDLTDAEMLDRLRENFLGDARLFIHHFRGKFVYVKRWARFIRWAGHHWQEDILETVYDGIEQICADYKGLSRRLYKEAGNLSGDELKANEALREALRKRVDRLRDTTGRDKLLKFVHTNSDGLRIDGQELDKQPYLMAFANGVVDLKTGKFRDGQPDDYIMNASPIEWQGIDADSTDWENFLLSCHDGKKDVVEFLQRLFGYGIMGERKTHVWAIHHGTRGRNGKDVLQNVLNAVLGDDICGMIPTEMLLDSKTPRNPAQASPDIMLLRGKRLAFANEAEDRQRFAISKIKALTGSGKIQGRALQDKLLTTWNQSHILHLFANEIPRAKADDDAFWVRLLIILWPLRFVDNPTSPDERQRDPDMEEKLRKNLAGVAAWLVRGALEYQRQGLNPPKTVVDYTNEQRGTNDDVGEFLDDCCDLEPPIEGREPTTRIQSSDLLDAFNWWFHRAKDASYSYSQRRFGEVIEKKRIKKKKSGGIQYLGVQLTRDFRQQYEQAKAQEEDRKSGGRRKLYD